MPAAGSGRQDGVVSVKATPSRRVSYGELIGGKTFNLPLNPKATRKHPREWTVLGTPVPRVDMRAMATGQFEFVHNVRVPGMLHGRVVRPPSVGATLVSVDESSVRGMPGLVKVVVEEQLRRRRRREAVAGDAGRREAAGDVDARAAALAAARRLRADRESSQPRDTLLVDSGTSTRRSRAATRRCARPICIRIRCTARSAARAPSPTCRPTRRRSGRRRRPPIPTRNTTAMLLGLKPEHGPRHLHARLRLLRHQRRRHGVLRRRAAVAGGRQARARAALAQGRDGVGELRQPLRRSISASALDANGNIVAWDYEAWSAARGGRPGYNTPGNVVTGMLLGFEPGAVHAPHAGPGTDAAAQQRHEHRAVVRHGPRWRRRGTAQASCAASACSRTRSVAVLHRSAALAGASAEHVRARVLHGRGRGAREGRSGRVPAAPSDRPAVEGRRSQAAAKAANWEARPSPKPAASTDRHCAAAAASPASATRATTATSRMVADVDVNQDTGTSPREAARRRAGLRPDLEPRRHAQPDRRRRAAGHEPRARRRGDVGRGEGHVGRLAHLPLAVRSASRSRASRAC